MATIVRNNHSNINGDSSNMSKDSNDRVVGNKEQTKTKKEIIFYCVTNFILAQ